MPRAPLLCESALPLAAWVAFPAILLGCASAAEPKPLLPEERMPQVSAPPLATAKAPASVAEARPETPAPALDFGEYRKRSELAAAAYAKKDYAAFLEHS